MRFKKFLSISVIPISLFKSFGLLSPSIQIPPYQIEKYNQVIQALYENNTVAPSKSVTSNIVNASQYFLNTPYRLFVMGEGPTGQFDQNPLYRTDLFDCESYVMTVLAISKGHDLGSFIQTIIHINYYSSQPNFIYRNHFTSCQWNINNQKNGFISDITAKIYKEAAYPSITINLQEWFHTLPTNRIQTLNYLTKQQERQLITTLRHVEINPPIISCHLPYIPTDTLTDPNSTVLQAIPNGAIIEIVNYDKKWQYTVSHMGFAIYIHHQLYFREASEVDKKVIDIPLVDYLKQFKNIGINVEQVN